MRACIGTVARAPSSAAALAAASALSSGSPASTEAARASIAGASASTIVLSPGGAAPSSTTPASAASSAASRACPSNSSPSPSARPARRSAVPQSGPLAPPTVETSVLPGQDEQPPGRDAPSCPASALPTASKPRSMFTPWSPSPIAASSWVRWSRRSLTDSATPTSRRGSCSCAPRLLRSPAHAPQRSAGVWTGASHRAVSSSSSSSSVSEAPAISSEVM